MIEIFRHAGRYHLNYRDVVGGGHVRPLLKSKNPELTEIVKKIATGQAYMAIAITESEAGSDVPSIRSTAKKVEGGYLLSGKKRINARLKQAAHVILFTQSASHSPGKLSAFVVPIPTAGLTIQHLSVHGPTGNSHQG